MSSMATTVARITDPRTVPVVAVDSHLPPVAPQHMTPQALRQRFGGGALGFEPEFSGDGARFSDRTPTAASVLVPLVMRPDGLQVLLTRRTDHLRDHAGQISFPGGRVEPDDADAVATALRETEEEVGIGHQHVEVIGALPDYRTVTSFVVTPVVALLDPGYTVALDSFEVAEAFEVPLSFLMTPAHHRRHAFESNGLTRHFLSMPWQAHDAPGGPREYFIWGATAAMLRNLYRALARPG
jgi:8-oxo-dGTP pyrophosphatase MutT (NUDIX family)